MTGKTRERRAAGRALDAAFGEAIDADLADALAHRHEPAMNDATETDGDAEAADESHELNIDDGVDDPDDDDMADADPASDDAAAALARAGVHARRSAAEAALAARALLDAGALAATGRGARETVGLARMADGLDALAASLGGDRPANEALLGAVAEAIDGEIGRWEARANDDPEARAVLRAWLGLRELLWEVGVRRRGEPRGDGARHREAGSTEQGRDALHAAKAQTRTAPLRGRRIQRVPLEG